MKNCLGSFDINNRLKSMNEINLMLNDVFFQLSRSLTTQLHSIKKLLKNTCKFSKFSMILLES